jgi:hypothetical protein
VQPDDTLQDPQQRADGEGDLAGAVAAGGWAEQLRLARARALAAGVTVHWDRLNVTEAEREATLQLRDLIVRERDG